MTTSVFPFILVPALTTLGVLAVGAKLSFYTTETLTYAAIYDENGDPLTNPVVADLAGRFPTIYVDDSIIYRVRLTTATNVQIGDDVDPFVSSGAVFGDLAADNGSTLITYKRPSVSSNVPHNLQTIITSAEWANVFEWLTDAEIAAVINYTSSADVTTKIQAAMTQSWLANKNLFFPAGLYNVGNLVVPGTSAGRTKAWKMQGQGSGEIFARGLTGGTILKAVGTASILTNVQDLPLAGDGNEEISYIRFEGNSSTPVVAFDTLYAQSEFHHNAIYQGGVGNGLEIRHANTIDIHHNYIINRDWNASGLGNTRVGIGLYIYEPNDNGLQMVRKNSVRGFLTNYKYGTGTGGKLYSLRMESCESSVSFNGINLTADAQGVVVDSCYLEGGEGGNGITDAGKYNKVINNLMFGGFTGGIVCDGALGYVYTGNLISAGSTANTKCIYLNPSAIGAGGTAGPNQLVFPGSGGSIAGVTAITIATTTSPRISGLGSNYFDPKVEWVGGAGTKKYDNSLVTSGVVATDALGKSGDEYFPLASRTGLSYFYGAALTNSAISGSVMTVTQDGTYFPVTLSSSASVNQFDFGPLDGRDIKIRTTNANLTIQASAFIKLDGTANWTAGSGGGSIMFTVERIAGVSYLFQFGKAISY